MIIQMTWLMLEKALHQSVTSKQIIATGSYLFSGKYFNQSYSFIRECFRDKCFAFMNPFKCNLFQEELAPYSYCLYSVLHTMQNIKEQRIFCGQFIALFTHYTGTIKRDKILYLFIFYRQIEPFYLPKLTKLFKIHHTSEIRENQTKIYLLPHSVKKCISVFRMLSNI